MKMGQYQPHNNFIVFSPMKKNTESNHKIIVLPPTASKRELAPQEIEMQPNSSLLDPYKNLIPERPEKLENPPFSKAEQLQPSMNLRSFFSNESELGDVPHEIASFLSSFEDEENPEIPLDRTPYSLIPNNPTEAFPSLHFDVDSIQPSAKKRIKKSQHTKNQGTSTERSFNTTKPVKKTPLEFQPSFQISCNCKKSSCLKMYCECFMNGSICGQSCQCIGCKNTPDFASSKKSKRSKRQEEGPKPISVKTTSHEIKLETSCSCKKTQCIKKYCQCFSSGGVCGPNCKCEGCLNQDRK